MITDKELQNNIRELVDRACRDEMFALQLKSAATDAGRAGPGTKEYRLLMEHLTDSEEDLRRLVNPGAVPDDGTTTITTTTTTTITTTAVCTATTLTTTTTVTTDFPLAAEQSPTPSGSQNKIDKC